MGVKGSAARCPELPPTPAPYLKHTGRVCRAGAEAAAISEEGGGDTVLDGVGVRGPPTETSSGGFPSGAGEGEVRRHAFTRVF